MGEHKIKNVMERQAFKESEKQADANISRIFNPENAYQRKQKGVISQSDADKVKKDNGKK
jgi:hypothetical protein